MPPIMVPAQLPPVTVTDQPPPLIPPVMVPDQLPPEVPPPVEALDQPPVDRSPLIETDPPPPVTPPIDPPVAPPVIDTLPAIAGPGTGGCVLRFVGQTLFYLRRDLNAVYPVPDLDVARVKCDFSGQTTSCLPGFPNDDPDPECRLGRFVAFRGPLQMNHCLYGTIDMSSANQCLPVAWAKTQLVKMDGQLLYVRLDTRTLYPVSKAVADRKGLTDITNCDSPAIGFCRSMRIWNFGPPVQIDSCLNGTIPMSRGQECVPPL
jgi:hypothetical protein